jgi:hypothetical protein
VDELGELYVCNYSGNIQRFAGNQPLPNVTLISPGNGALNVPLPATMRWRQAPGATLYWLEVDTSQFFTSPLVRDSTLSDTAYSAGTLGNLTQYHWRVKGKNAAGWGSFPPAWTFTTVPLPPAAPALLSPADGAPNQPLTPTLMWNPAAGASTYRLQLAPDSLLGTLIVDDSTLTDTSHQAGSLSRNTLYFWRVSAKNGGGTSPWSDRRSFTTTPDTTRRYMAALGWNVLSAPMLLSDGSATTLFPTATSGPFVFVTGSGYAAEDTLVNGPGYWVKFPSADTIGMTGVPLTIDTIDVVQGWNLIGSIADTVQQDSVIQVPPGIIQSGFITYTSGSGYTQRYVIQPANAYWVKVSQAGKLILMSVPGAGRSKGSKGIENEN